MASFRKRNNKWQVRIQRQDYPTIAKSFIELKTAKQWASQVEREMILSKYDDSRLLGLILKILELISSQNSKLPTRSFKL